MAFRIEITRQAKQDLRSLLSWLRSQAAGETGSRWYEGMEAAMASLAEFPACCPLARENASTPFEVRQLLHGSKRY